MADSKLTGKKAAITGATGGLGSELCRYALMMDAELILIGRNPQKEKQLKRKLLREFPGAKITCLSADFLHVDQVQALAQQLGQQKPDLLYLNAGNYYMERVPCETGFDPVYQINFLSQYYLAKKLMPVLAENRGKLIVTGSIAHKMVRTDPGELDFRNHRSPEEVYGNSKRYLMFACEKLAEKYPEVQFAIAHPGITPTGITSNYPEKLRKFIKLPMKITFQPARKAAIGMAVAMALPIPSGHWIGPGVFHIWGRPDITPLKSCDSREKEQIFRSAEALYRQLAENRL